MSGNSKGVSPIIFHVDLASVGSDSVVHKIIEQLSQAVENDVAVVPRSLVDASHAKSLKGDKTKTKQNKKKEDEKDAEEEPNGFSDEVIEAIREKIDAECASRMQTEPSKAAPPVRDKKLSYAANIKSSITSIIAEDREKEVKEREKERDGVSPLLDKTRSLLHVLLVDVCRNAGDMERLRNADIPLHTIMWLQPTPDGLVVPDEEFHQKAPTASETAKTGKLGVPLASSRMGVNAPVTGFKSIAHLCRAPPSPWIEELKEKAEHDTTWSNILFSPVFVPKISEDTPMPSTPGAAGLSSISPDKKKDTPAKDGGKDKDREGEMENRLAALLANEIRSAVRITSQQHVAYHEWKHNLQLINIPPALPADQVDMRLYRHLLNMPDETVSIPVIMKAMFEQVAVTTQQADTSTILTAQEAKDISSLFDNLAIKALDTQGQQPPPQDQNKDIKSRVLMPWGDSHSIAAAQSCASKHTHLQNNSFCEEAYRDCEQWWPMPGVHRHGLPDAASLSLARRAIEHTEVQNMSSLPPSMFARALTIHHFKEMLRQPCADFRVTMRDPDLYFHLDHLDKGSDSSVIEASVRVRLDQIRTRRRGAGGAAPVGSMDIMSARQAAPTQQQSNGMADESVEDDEEEERELEEHEAQAKAVNKLLERIYDEYMEPYVLSQVLREACFSARGLVSTQARYVPLDDSLLVICHARTPISREKKRAFRHFLCPNMSLHQWLGSGRTTQQRKRGVLYNFRVPFDGQLAWKDHVMYPADRTVLGRSYTQSGSSAVARVWLERGSEQLAMERGAHGGGIVLTALNGGKSRVVVEEGRIYASAQQGAVMELSADQFCYLYQPKDLASSPPGRAPTHYRCVTPHGSVIQCQDGVTTVLTPEGACGQCDSAKAGVWTWVGHDGVRWRVFADGRSEDLPPIAAVKQVDSESGSVVFTRNDLTMYISYRNGSSLLLSPDGTRIHSELFPTINKRKIIVEMPHCAPIILEHEQLTVLAEGPASRLGLSSRQRARGAPVVPAIGLGNTGGSVVTPLPVVNEMAATGSMMTPMTAKGVVSKARITLEVALLDGTKIQRVTTRGTDKSIDAQGDVSTITRASGAQYVIWPGAGRAVYNPCPTSPVQDMVPPSQLEAQTAPRGTYIIDMKEGVITSRDEEENAFTVALEESKTQASLSCTRGLNLLSNDRNFSKYLPLPSDPLPPRLFIIRGDGSGHELLVPDEFLKWMEGVRSDPSTIIVPPEPLPQVNPEGRQSSSSLGLRSVSSRNTHSAADMRLRSSQSLTFLKELLPFSPYIRTPNIPSVMKAHPDARGWMGQMKGPTTFIVYRAVTQHPPLTDNELDTVHADLQAHRDFREKQVEEDDKYVVDDPRSEQERHEEVLLQHKVLALRQQREEIKEQERALLQWQTNQSREMVKALAVKSARSYSPTSTATSASTARPGKAFSRPPLPEADGTSVQAAKGWKGEPVNFFSFIDPPKKRKEIKKSARGPGAKSAGSAPPATTERKSKWAPPADPFASSAMPGYFQNAALQQMGSSPSEAGNGPVRRMESQEPSLDGFNATHDFKVHMANPDEGMSSDEEHLEAPAEMTAPKAVKTKGPKASSATSHRFGKSFDQPLDKSTRSLGHTAALTNPVTLSPSQVDFGTVGAGGIYRVTIVLSNPSTNKVRFAVVQPAPPKQSTDSASELGPSAVAVLYKPGAVAPGLSRKLDVQLHAGAPGALNEIIIVKTEEQSMGVRVAANVVEYTAEPVAQGVMQVQPPLSDQTRFGPPGKVRAVKPPSKASRGAGAQNATAPSTEPQQQ